MSGQSSKSLESVLLEARGHQGGVPSSSTSSPPLFAKARITASLGDGRHSIELVDDNEVDSGLTFDDVSDYAQGSTVYTVNDIVIVYRPAGDQHPYIFASNPSGGESTTIRLVTNTLGFLASS
jgi:hypothetical protein